MKNIETMADQVIAKNDHYIVSITPDELYYLKSALSEYITTITDEINTYEWLDTIEEHKRLERLEKMLDDMNNLPF